MRSGYDAQTRRCREPRDGLTLADGAALGEVQKETQMSRSGERARGFGGETMPCVRQSPQQPANFCTSSVILAGFPASTQWKGNV